MNLVLKSCRSDALSMTVEVLDQDTGRLLVAGIGARTCGTPFLGHDASVKQLIGDIVEGLNTMLRPAVVADAPVEVAEPVPALAVVKKGKTLPPKGAA